jgi:HlyD family secretion protein
LKAANNENDSVQAAAPQKEASKRTDLDKDEVQGVFVIRHDKAEFIPVETGITGTTDIEVLSGLKPGDEIVTGSYKVLRTMRPGVSIKIDNAAPEKKEDES